MDWNIRIRKQGYMLILTDFKNWWFDVSFFIMAAHFDCEAPSKWQGLTFVQLWLLWHLFSLLLAFLLLFPTLTLPSYQVSIHFHCIFMQCDSARWWLPLTGLPGIPWHLTLCSRSPTIIPGTNQLLMSLKILSKFSKLSAILKHRRANFVMMTSIVRLSSNRS